MTAPSSYTAGTRLRRMRGLRGGGKGRGCPEEVGRHQSHGLDHLPLVVAAHRPGGGRTNARQSRMGRLTAQAPAVVANRRGRQVRGGTETHGRGKHPRGGDECGDAPGAGFADQGRQPVADGADQRADRRHPAGPSIDRPLQKIHRRRRQIVGDARIAGGRARLAAGPQERLQRRVPQARLECTVPSCRDLCVGYQNSHTVTVCPRSPRTIGNPTRNLRDGHPIIRAPHPCRR